MTDSISALNLEAGQVVGGYTLVSRLGGGAMGTVWTVHDDAGQTFAMKILRDSLSDDSGTLDTASGEFTATGRGIPDEQREQITARERLRREALALSRVRHPGVASIVDMELDDALAFIVTELIDGDNLREDVAANGAYTGEDLELLTEKLSSAVAAVHKAGIIHRDIKPMNVMISATGPVLVDFGIAMGEGESHVTRTGLVMGTPGFIAPEVIEGSESDEATDWWSVASVLAFAATGKPVFGTKPIMAVLEREASGNADLQGLPPRTAKAFTSALSPHREERISIGQLLSVVRQDALESSGLGAGAIGATAGPGTGTGVLPNIPLPPRPEASTETSGFPALSKNTDADGSQKSADDAAHGTGVVRPFDEDSTGFGGSGVPLPPPSASLAPTAGTPQSRTSLRSQWTHTPGDEANAIPNSAADSAAPDELATTALSGADLQGTRALSTTSNDVPGGTRVMPQGAVPTTVLEQSDGTPTTAMTTAVTPPDTNTAPGDSYPNSALSQLRQPLPDGATVAMPPAQQTYDVNDYPPPELFPAPVVPPREIMQQQVRARFGGSGKMLANLLAVPIALMCAWLPAGGAIIALVIICLAAARGYSVHAQLQRESKRGGEKKRFDGAVSVLSSPVHLAHALIATLPKAVLWALLYTLANLLAITLANPTTVTSGITLFSRTFTFGMLAGSPRTLSGIVLGLSAAVAWLANTAIGSAPSPVATGFASAWNSLRRGIAKVADPEAGMTDVSAIPSAAASYDTAGNPLATPEGAESSRPRSKRSAMGVTLLIVLIAGVVAAVTMFLVAPTIDWSPIVTLEA